MAKLAGMVAVDEGGEVLPMSRLLEKTDVDEGERAPLPRRQGEKERVEIGRTHPTNQ